jgi:transcriptional regulator with XRE-family HTH domain
LLREAREAAGLTQASLAERLGTSQQAVAQAERPDGNPTVSFMRSWARACNAVLTLDVRRQQPPLG